MADNPFDQFDPQSPYDALFGAAPAEKSPYDALLGAAPSPKASPYDALLAAAPETSPESAAAPESTTPVTETTSPSHEDISKFITKPDMGALESSTGPVVPADPAWLASKGSTNFGALGSAILKTLLGGAHTYDPQEESPTERRQRMDQEKEAAGREPLLSQADNPVVRFPYSTGESIPAGIGRGVSNIATSLTTPENLALMATIEGAPAVVGKMAAVGFGAMMTKDLPDQIAAIGEAKTPADKAQAITEAIATAGMIVLSAKHAAGRTPGSAADRAASMEAAVLRAKERRDAGDFDGAYKELSAGMKALATAKQGAPEPAETVGKQPISPEVIDGLVRSRNALVRAAASAEDIADVSQQLDAFDPAEVSAAEARAAQPRQSPPPAGEAAPPVTTEGPSKESASASSFKQAQEEHQKAAADLARTASDNAEVAPLAAAEAAKIASGIAKTEPTSPIPERKKSFRELMDENEARQNSEDAAITKARIEGTEKYTPAIRLEDGKVVKSQKATEGHGELSSFYPEQKVEHGFVNNQTGRFMNVMEVARENEPPTATQSKTGETNALNQVSLEKSRVSEHQGVPPGVELPAHENEVRQEGGEPPGSSGGAEPAAEVPAAEAKVAPPKKSEAALSKMRAAMADLEEPPAPEPSPAPPASESPKLRIVPSGNRFKIVNAADEQVGKRTYEKESHAQRAMAKIGQRSTFGIPPSKSGNDIIDAIIEQGGINLSGMSREERDNAFPHKGAWRNALTTDNPNLTPDEVARLIAPGEGEAGHGDGDQRTMFDLINQAIKERGTVRDQQAAEIKNQRSEVKRARQFERAALTPKEGETGTAVSDLKVGDEVMVEGEKVTVTHIDPDTGDVTMKDGTRFRTQTVEEGKVIYGEITPVETDALADWPDIETPEDAKTYADNHDLTDEAQPPVEPPTGSIEERPPEAKGTGGVGGTPPPEGGTPAAPERPVDRARRVLELRRQEIIDARAEGDFELAASLGRVIPKLERDLAALEKPAEEQAAPSAASEPVELWQRTREQVGGNLLAHREAVKAAVKEGKPVPQDVLEEYGAYKWGEGELKRRRREERKAAKEKAVQSAPQEPEKDTDVVQGALQESPKLAEGQTQGDLLSGGDVNTGKTANVTNEAGGTLVRVGGQIVAKLNQKGAVFTPEFNENGKKLTAEQKVIVDQAAKDYTKTWQKAKVKEGANKPLAAADVTTQTDMLPGAPESDVPLFEGPKPDAIRDALQRARDALRDKPGELLSDPFLIKTFGKPVLRTALDIAIKAYDGGKALLEAIELGVEHLRQWASENGKNFEEDRVREFFQPFIDADKATPATETPAGTTAPVGPESTAAPENTSSLTETPTPSGTAQPRVVALRKSFTDAQREKMGLPAWDKPAALTNQEAWDEGQRVLAEDPKAGERLVAEMKSKPRALNPYEKAILLHEEGVRDTEYHAAIDAVNKATTEEDYLSAQVRLDTARDSNQEFYDSARAAGRASGQSLQAHKMALDTETWTLARMEDAIQARMPFGEKLSDKKNAPLRKQIEELHAQLAAERERADKAEAETKATEVEKLAQRVAWEAKRQSRAEASAVKSQGGTFVSWMEKQEQAAMERIKARRGKLFSTIDPLNLAGLADELVIGASKVTKGLVRFGDWLASMKADLGDYFEPQAKAMFEESKKRAANDKKTFDSAPSKGPKKPSAASAAEGETPAKAPKTKEDILNGIKEGAEKPDQKTIYDLVRSRIEENPDVTLDKGKVSEIMQGVRDDLSEQFPDITEDEVRDAFTGHGKVTYPSKEQVNVKMRELRSAGDLISKIGEAARGEHPQQTGKRRDKPTQFLRDLTKEVIRTMRENGVDTKALEGMMKTAHDARVTRLKNAIEDTQAQIAAGKRTPKTPGTEWTPEELALSQQLGGLREKLDAMLDEPDSDELNRILNRIETVTEKLRTGDIEPKAKSQNVPTKAVSEASENLGQLNKELSDRRRAAREAANPPKTEDERKIEALERQEEKLSEQIRTGRIDQPTGKPTVDTKALADAKNRVAELRRQIVEMRQAKRDALNPPKTEEEKTLAALEKRQRAAEEAIRTGKLEARTGRATADTPAVAKAKADLREINRQLAEARKKSAAGIQRELDRYRKMIEGKMADLRGKISRGDVSSPVRNPLSPEKTAIAKPLKVLQDQWENMKRQQELKSQTLPQKVLRWTTYLAHEMLLLSPAVGVKLSSAAATTAALVRPLEEVVGYGVGKALPFLAEKGDVEIATSAKSLVHHEAKAAAEAFMNIINDIGSTLKHGKTDFELEFGKEYSNEMVSYVGRFHGAFKTIPARQAFTATFLRLAEKYAQRGLDITNPEVRFSIGTQALFKAIESKFQDPNLAVGAFRDAVRYIERKSPAVGAVTKAIAHTEMPVMTVASNITWRALENVYGLPVGSARIANMYLKNLLNNSFGKKGGGWVEKRMSDMSTEQADSIAKQLKRGTVGAAAFLIGAYIYQNLGGIHQKGDKEKPGDIKPEEVRPPETVRDAIRSIPLVGRPSGDIPKEFAHHPTFIDMQAGATMMRVAEAMKQKEGGGDFSDKAARVAKGTVAAGIATAAESPFGQAIQEGVKWIDPATRLDAEGNFARTFLGLTGPLAWLAKKQDIDPSTGEATRRKATTLGEELKLAIPSKRKEVPEATTHRHRREKSIYD